MGHRLHWDERRGELDATRISSVIYAGQSGRAIGGLAGRAQRLDRASTAQLALRCAQLLGTLVSAGGSMACTWARERDGAERRQAVFAGLADSVVRLGPGAVKLSQLLATRRDLLPDELCTALQALWGDRVDALSAADVADAEAVARTLPPSWGRPRLVGSGSIAHVFHLVAADGTERAVKVVKPGVADQVRLDMALARHIGTLVGRLPPARGIPVKQMVDQLCDAIEAQTDLVAEAQNLEALGTSLAGLTGVRVPEVLVGDCDETWLAMEWVPASARGGDLTEKAEQIMLLVYEMLFRGGLVHIDLHPGNLDVHGSEVVVYDAGFVMSIDRSTRKALAMFFLGLAVGDGEACARAVVNSCAAVQPGFEFETFASAMQDIVDQHTGARSGTFNVVTFAGRLFEVQRRFRVYPEASFVFPLLSLVAVEGQVRELDPDLDFQQLSIPYVGYALEH